MNSMKTKELTKLKETLERAIESRTDMELGLKSVRLKFDRSTNVMKKLQDELKNMETVCDERVFASKEEVESLHMALDMSKRKQETVEEKHHILQDKFEQMKKMLQHLADANGQVARVYGALGTRLTEVRAEQAAARGSLEASREGMIFLKARIEDAGRQQTVNQTMMVEKDAMLENREKRLRGMKDELMMVIREKNTLLNELESFRVKCAEIEKQKIFDNKSIMRLNAELVQTRNTVRKIESSLTKSTIENTSSKNERVRLISELESMREELRCEREMREEETARAKRSDLERRSSLTDSTSTVERLNEELRVLREQTSKIKMEKKS